MICEHLARHGPTRGGSLQGAFAAMPEHRRVEVSEVGDVTVVRFVDRRILDIANIEEMGTELFGLIEDEHRKSLLLNFAGVEFLSSAALNKLLILEKKLSRMGGKLKLCNLRPEIQEVFVITRLHEVFDIREGQREALEAF
jgi:anti-sigma B factor antagonist